jgi:hypothetical protein
MDLIAGDVEKNLADALSILPVAETAQHLNPTPVAPDDIPYTFLSDGVSVVKSFITEQLVRVGIFDHEMGAQFMSTVSIPIVLALVAVITMCFVMFLVRKTHRPAHVLLRPVKCLRIAEFM